MGTKTDIWRVDCVGKTTFNQPVSNTEQDLVLLVLIFIQDGGSGWRAFQGEIVIDSSVKTGGFKAAGLSVKDFLVLSVTLPDPREALFSDLRLVIPIRLATDAWTAVNGSNLGVVGSGSDYSLPNGPYSRDVVTDDLVT
jgi:hypothetical protein